MELSGPFPPTEFARLRLEHWELMADYSRILGDAEREGRGRTGTTRRERRAAGTLPGMRLPLAGMFVRLLCAAHVRRTLRGLEDRYAQLRSTLDPDDPHEATVRAWLSSAMEDAARVREPLPWPWRRLLFAVTSVGALLSVRGIVPDEVWSQAMQACVVVETIYLAGILPANFRAGYLRKRDLFLPRASWIDRRESHEQRAHLEPNTYHREDVLFGLLGSCPPVCEIEYDRLVLMLHWIVMIGCTAAASLVLLTADVRLGVLAGLVTLAACRRWYVTASRIPERIWV
jgi:hypothetical protein